MDSGILLHHRQAFCDVIKPAYHEIIATRACKASKNQPFYPLTSRHVRPTIAALMRSEYQNKVIAGYYDNLDSIMLQKLGELVTELYLADTDAKKKRLWQRAEKAMQKLKIKPAIIDHIMTRKKPEILAKNLQDWLKHTKNK